MNKLQFLLFPAVQRFLGLAFAIAMSFGYAGTSNAATCSVSDVEISGNTALTCGWSTLYTNDAVTPPPGDWSVNDDEAGGLDFTSGELWLAYMKAEVAEPKDEFGDPIPEAIGDPALAGSEWSLEETGQLDGSGIDLKFTAYTGTCDTVADPECVPDFYSSGEITLNVGEDGRLLIVMKDGANDLDGYHWYYFEGLTSGQQSGSLWNTEQAFGGNNISHMTAYTTDTVFPPTATPVPPAVWLFGSGLVGLVGIARRKAA